MTTSIFSKLSQQSKHRDLLENQDPDAPPIGNPRTSKTIAEFRAMGLDVRMACASCRTRGPLDLAPLPKGADTESRLVAARCPSCGSEAVSQEIVPLGSIDGPLFTAFLRTPRVSPPKSLQRHKPVRPEILSDDDLPADLLPILEKEIVEDDEDEREQDEAEGDATPSRKPQAPATSAKTASKPSAKASAKTPGKPDAKTAPTAPSKPSAKASAKASLKAMAALKPVAQTAAAQTSAKPVVKTAAKATALSKAIPKGRGAASAKAGGAAKGGRR